MTAKPPRLTAADLQRRFDTRTKPQGSLGRLETLGIRIGLALQSVTPTLSAPHILVFAGDHGLAAEGVSNYPREVTAQMVGNYLAGGAAINVLARQFGLGLTVVDAGVAGTLTAAPGLASHRHGFGTRNALYEPAMSTSQCTAAIAAGRHVAAQALTNGSNALLLGEMGIGNTASAALLLHATLHWPLERCVGRGTGLDDAGLTRKLDILERAAQRCPAPLAPLDALREFGGFELAMLVGAILESAHRNCIVVVDGFAVTVAALLASRLDASAQDRTDTNTHTDLLSHCVFSHCSAEHAHRALLQYLEVEPLLDLELRLGEASGAALAWPLIEAAARLLSEMASFESAQVSTQSLPDAPPKALP